MMNRLINKKRRVFEAVSKEEMDDAIELFKDETKFDFNYVADEDYWVVTDPKGASGWTIANRLALKLKMPIDKFYQKYEIIVFDDRVEIGVGLFYVDERGRTRTIKTFESVSELSQDAGYDEINNELDDASFEDFCKQLDFLVNAKDQKAKALFDTFKKGWKQEYGKVEVVTGDIFIRDLHPTQNVIYANKSLGKILNGSWKIDGFDYAVDALLSEQNPSIQMGDPLVVCEVGGTYYLIDGHHRWSKAYSFNPNCKMSAHLIKNSGNIFKTADDVLKFAQGTLTALRNSSPINTAQPENDYNMYNISQKELHSIISNNLTDEVLQHVMDSPLLNGIVKGVDGLYSYLWANINIMKKYAPAGIHDRVFMPQYPDGDSNPINALDRIAAESVARRNPRTSGNIIRRGKSYIKLKRN